MSRMFVRIGAIENCLFEEIRFVPLRLVLPTVCAWCPGYNRNDRKNKGVSHGLCEACSIRMQEKTS